MTHSFPTRRSADRPGRSQPRRRAGTVAVSGEQPIIIIKRKRRASHGTHHSGAWKVAYADFVTAMMAFFLLLWLLNVTTDEQRNGIADYFEPANIEKDDSGSGGILGGTTVTSPGQPTSTSSTI